MVNRAAQRSDKSTTGSVPPRVVQEVVNHAQWADNEFIAEYLSGILASARTLGGASDAGVPWCALVGRLSSDQLALHWALYAYFQGNMRTLGSEEFWKNLGRQIAIDYPTLFLALGWQLNDSRDTNRLMDAAYGLKREGLFSDLTHGPGNYLQESVSWTHGHNFNHDHGYLSLKLTSEGVGLLLHALGLGTVWFGDIGSNEVSEAVDETELLPNLQHGSTLALNSKEKSTLRVHSHLLASSVEVNFPARLDDFGVVKLYCAARI